MANGTVHTGTVEEASVDALEEDCAEAAAGGDEAAVEPRPEVGRLSEEQAVERDWREATAGDSDLRCLCCICRQPWSRALMAEASRLRRAFSCSSRRCDSTNSSVFSFVCSSSARRADCSRLAFSHLLEELARSRQFSSVSSCTVRSRRGASASRRDTLCPASSL